MDRETLLRMLNEALTLEVRSFARYVFEISLPRIEGPVDSELMDLLRDIVRDEDRRVDRIVELVESLDEKPEIGTYGFDIGFYNYLRGEYLVRVVIEQLEKHLEKLRSLQTRLDGEPAAQSILDDAVQHEERHLERLETLAARTSP